VWWDYWNEPKLQTKQVTIHVSGISGSVKITESVPHFENGLLLQNSREVYPNFFDKGSASVTNNQITITLGKSPVYIEQTTENLGNYIPHIWNDSPSPSNYTCPNKQCETSLGENSKNCPADCGSSASYTCPNKVCESSLGENSKNCPADCTSVNK
jgi:hypothetical protein